MKNEKRNIEFTAIKIGANINFKVDVKVKESFLTRFINLFKSEKIVTMWLSESQAGSTSNYIFNEVKRIKKSFVVSSEDMTTISSTKEKAAKPKTLKDPREKVVSEGPLESAKPKRHYSRKPRKEKNVETEK